MRIDTALNDQDREAAKAYADANNLTMKGAYTRLLRSALWGRTALAYFPDTDNYGVRQTGYDTSIRTNIDADRIDSVLRSNPGEWHYLYWPRRFALEEAGVEIDSEPCLFDSDTPEDAQPRTGQWD